MRWYPDIWLERQTHNQDGDVGSALLGALVLWFSECDVLIWVHTLFLYEILFPLSLQYEVCGNHLSFSVDDSEAAEKLAIIDRKITRIKEYKVCCI
jgi:hypothetical protein